MKILNGALLSSLLILTFNTNAQNLSLMVNVASSAATGDTYEVDPSSIEVLSDGNRSAWIRYKRGYKETPRPIFDDFDAKLQRQAYNCNNNSFTIYEIRSIDKSGNVIKYDFSFQPDDPRLTFNTIVKGSVAELSKNYVCGHSIRGNSVASERSGESVILSKYPSNQDWASLGPDSNNKFTFFLLRQSVIKKGNFLGYISKLEYDPLLQIEGKLAKSIINENFYDCRSTKYQTLKEEFISPQGAVISEHKIDPEFAPWVNSPKGSFAERVGSVYCKK